MMVSVIMPSYNAAHTIERAIHSCLNQTLRDIEVIVVDDGSSDGTSAAALRAGGGDARLQVITLAQNGGVSRARNAGLTAARGEWIALLDADDMYAPDRLEVLVGKARELGADMLADNLWIHWDTARPSQVAFPEKRMRTPGPISAAHVASTDRPRWGMPAAGFMKPIMRRQFLLDHAIRYVEDMHAGEDFHLYMQCLLRGARLFYLFEAYYIYHVAQTSLSRAKADRVRNAILNSSRELSQEAEQAGDTAALDELRARERDFRLWLPFKAVEEAIEDRRYLEAVRLFTRLPSKTYALLRFAGRGKAVIVESWKNVSEDTHKRWGSPPASLSPDG